MGSTSVGSDEREGPDPNKGHHTFDSNERINRFYKINASGWEDEYQKYREGWHSNPEQKSDLAFLRNIVATCHMV